MKAISSSRVFVAGELIEAAVLFDAGIIRAIVDKNQIPDDCEHQDMGDLVIMPGLIDTHVHINEPGRTDWEGFNTATQAAAAGGINHRHRYATKLHSGNHKRCCTGGKTQVSGKSTLGRYRFPWRGHSG